MTITKQAVKVLLDLEDQGHHEEKCPRRRTLTAECTCYLRRNAVVRAEALSEAGLLREVESTSPRPSGTE